MTQMALGNLHSTTLSQGSDFFEMLKENWSSGGGKGKVQDPEQRAGYYSSVVNTARSVSHWVFCYEYD